MFSRTTIADLAFSSPSLTAQQRRQRRVQAGRSGGFFLSIPVPPCDAEQDPEGGARSYQYTYADDRHNIVDSHNEPRRIDDLTGHTEHNANSTPSDHRSMTGSSNCPGPSSWENYHYPTIVVPCRTLRWVDEMNLHSYQYTYADDRQDVDDCINKSPQIEDSTGHTENETDSAQSCHKSMTGSNDGPDTSNWGQTHKPMTDTSYRTERWVDEVEFTERLGAALDISSEDQATTRDVANQIKQAIAYAHEREENEDDMSSVHVMETDQANERFFGNGLEEVMMEERSREDAEVDEISTELDEMNLSFQMSVEGDRTDIEDQRVRSHLSLIERAGRALWFHWLNRLQA